MRQRIAIAMALESQSDIEGAEGERGAGDAAGASGVGTAPGRRGGIIIADEPTTSLDSMTQRSVVDYIKGICEAGEKTLLYVSHNLGVLQYICDHLMVLKDGRIVEQGHADDLYFRAQHPYTKQIVGETLKIMGKEAM